MKKNKDEIIQDTDSIKTDKKFGDLLLLDISAELLKSIEGDYKSCCLVSRYDFSRCYEYRIKLRDEKKITIRSVFEDKENFIGLDKNKYDSIVIGKTHVREPESFFKSILNKLNNGGSVYIAVDKIEGFSLCGETKININNFNIFKKE